MEVSLGEGGRRDEEGEEQKSSLKSCSNNRDGVDAAQFFIILLHRRHGSGPATGHA